ncbi:MAG: hypothetical protein WCG01_02220 [bacterium]
MSNLNCPQLKKQLVNIIAKKNLLNTEVKILKDGSCKPNEIGFMLDKLAKLEDLVGELKINLVQLRKDELFKKFGLVEVNVDPSCLANKGTIAKLKNFGLEMDKTAADTLLNIALFHKTREQIGFDLSETCPNKLRLVCVDAHEIGLEDGATSVELVKRAQSMGFELCPAQSIVSFIEQFASQKNAKQGMYNFPVDPITDVRDNNMIFIRVEEVNPLISAKSYKSQANFGEYIFKV